MNNETKMFETVKSIRDAMNTAAANTSVLYTLLIEQIGNHTVVSTEFVLPELWYVENCKEATEWANTQYPSEAWVNMEFIGNNLNEMGTVSGFNGKRGSREEITRDQFIEHVWKPWKAEQEKPRYWRLINDNGYGLPYFKLGIFQSDFCHRIGSSTVIQMAETFPEDWQPATEAEYLAQEAAKRKDIGTVMAEAGIDISSQAEQGTPFDEAKTQRPDTDISNLTEPKFKVGDEVELPDGATGKIKELDMGRAMVKLHNSTFNRLPYIEDLKPYAPPKFDLETADKTKMYFGTCQKWGDGIVYYRHKEWVFDTFTRTCMHISDCTHIDHEPIQRRN